MEEFNRVTDEVYRFVADTKIFVDGDQKLGRMEDLMKYLGSPQERLKVLHVAGTSGKTSTAYYAASLLHTAGQKVGLTVSPHVVDVRERAQVGLNVLGYDDYAVEMREFLEIVQRSKIKPSFFEFFVGFFFWLADKTKLDYAVVETGLGGLYDATNVVKRRDKVCLITDIGFDHIDILGRTLPEIAVQKAGIIHGGNEVLMHEQAGEVMDAMMGRAAEAGALIQVVSDEEYKELPRFQSRNASLAMAAVKFVLERDDKEALTHEQIQEALKIQVPARAEEFTYRGKKVLIDGAHNPQKLGVFTEYVKERYSDKKIKLVFTLGENKVEGVDEDMRAAREISDDIVLTTFKDTSVETNYRESLSMALLGDAAKKAGFKKVEVVQDAIEALDEAVGSDSDIVVVTGSFYLLSYIRPKLIGG